MSLMILFFNGGGGTAAPVTSAYPRFIYLINGRLAIRVAGKIYRELPNKSYNKT